MEDLIIFSKIFACWGVVYGIYKLTANYAMYKFKSEHYKELYSMKRKFYIDSMITFRQVLEERNKVTGIKNDPAIDALDNWIIQKLGYKEPFTEE